MEKIKIFKTEIIVRANVELSLTADDWELYDLPHRGKVAEELNRAIECLLAEGAPLSRLRAVLSLPGYARLGAADTEGYAVLYDVLKAVGYPL